jgi:hypothetical protein
MQCRSGSSEVAVKEAESGPCVNIKTFARCEKEACCSAQPCRVSNTGSGVLDLLIYDRIPAGQANEA